MATPNLQPDLNFFPNAQSVGTQPSPWFTVANQFLPRNLQEVIKWSKYIIMQSPTAAEVIRKYCTYPITEFIVDTKSKELETRYKSIFESFKLKTALQDIGFDYHTLGNVFVSVFFPIQRTLICPSCKTGYNAKKATFFTFKQFKFHGKCPKCSNTSYFQVHDMKSINVADMNIIKWDPACIVVNHNPITGEYEYFYKIPNDIKTRIRKGDTLFINSLPWPFIEAVQKNKDFKFDNDNIFHLRNISTGAMVEGCSVPPLITLYNLVFYQATLRKANESIAVEHMAPLRVIFPAAGSQNADPVVAMSMRNFVSNMTDAIKKHKQDHNHVLIAPNPVGVQAIGGDGKNLLVSQEIQQAEEMILLSLGVSRELLSGQTNWTSSTVGLRLLANALQTYLIQVIGVLNWIMTKTTSYLGIETVHVDMTPFKLSDDDTVKSLLVQLATNPQVPSPVSMTSTFEALGMNYEDELEKQKKDAISKAVAEVEMQYEVDEARYLAAKNIETRLNRNTDYQALLTQAQNIAMSLLKEAPEMAQEALNQIKLSSYPLYVMVMKLLEEYRTNIGAQQQQEAEIQSAQGAAAEAGAKGEGEGGGSPAPVAAEGGQ